MSAKTIDQLPLATSLPSSEELVVPVFKLGTNGPLYKISVFNLAALIAEEVLNNQGVYMVSDNNGIRFIKSTTKVGK